MNRRVTFKTLWLISERDRTARRQSLNSPKTLLLGLNGTGKSRITKNLFWVFGCEPIKRNVGSWDPDTVAGLDFTFDGKDYLVLRQGKRIGLFTDQGKLLFSADNIAAWSNYIGPFFGYLLRLQRPNSINFSQAGLDYLTLPFYMDQDGSWGTDWDTYTGLGQFKNWKSPTFEAFIGLRPNAYFEAKQLRDEVKATVQEKRKEIESQKTAFKRVHEILPRNLPSLNLTTFRAELAELGRKAIKTQEQQVSLRGKLLATVNLRESLNVELQLAVSAHRELVSDLTYLSEIPETVLECPTCGTRHKKSFHGKLQLSQDVDSIAALVAELNKRLIGVREDESCVRGDLRKMGKTLSDLDGTLNARKARLKLDDVLAAHSKKTLDIAFHRVVTDLTKTLEKYEDQEKTLQSQLKKFEDKKRLRDVGKYYSDQVASLSTLLNVPSDEQIGKAKPSARAQAGGSSAPRSMLAVHLAMLRTNIEHGDSPFFPFVVDTPQQSGQDDKNLKTMIEVLGRSAGDGHQIVLAVEKLPDGVNISSYEVVMMEGAKGALREGDFMAAVERLKMPLLALQAAIVERLEQGKVTPS